MLACKNKALKNLEASLALILDLLVYTNGITGTEAEICS